MLFCFPMLGRCWMGQPQKATINSKIRVDGRPRMIVCTQPGASSWCSRTQPNRSSTRAWQRCRTTVQYTVFSYFTLLCYTLLYSTLLYSTLFYSTLLYSTLLYSTLLYSTLLYRAGQPGSMKKQRCAPLRLNRKLKHTA